MRFRLTGQACLCALLAAALAPCGASAADPDLAPADAVDHGRDLFRIYCASCHGPRGRGDGPVAPELVKRPADLTVLARANGGIFPDERVRSSIDGRADLRSHGNRAMPIWGLAFQETDTDVAQEAEVERRIAWLVEFLQSIQERD